jgi:hypothetical protein
MQHPGHRALLRPAVDTAGLHELGGFLVAIAVAFLGAAVSPPAAA